MDIIGENSSLKNVFKVVNKAAPADTTVLVTGESGTGKELIVRALHDRSPRSKKPFIPINCGAIPKDLLESELFGHEKGSFTGAMTTKLGRFELAEGGTIFLDEIGEMDMSLQVKILRVLQEKEIERVGGTGPRKVDVRIVAATNRDLEVEVEKENFREDLYYRLNIIPIHLPPLRERKNDTLLLIKHFLAYFCRKKNRKVLELSEKAQQIFLAYPWPGNVRELENFMERLSILVDTDTVEVSDIPVKILNAVGDLDSLPEVDKAMLAKVAQEQALKATENPNRLKGSDKKANSPLIDLSTAGQPQKENAKNLQSILNPPVADDDEEENITTTAPVSTEFVYPTIKELKKFNVGLKEFLEMIENKLIDEALQISDNVKNHAAETLGIKRTTLIEKLKKRNMD